MISDILQNCAHWINNFLQIEALQRSIEKVIFYYGSLDHVWLDIHSCCIFWLAFGCFALQTLVEMLIFIVFCAKKLFLVIKPLNSILVQKNTHFFAKFWCKFLTFFSFFRFSAWKTLKFKMLTVIWSAQHPKTDRNIQHIVYTKP